MKKFNNASLSLGRCRRVHVVVARRCRFNEAGELQVFLGTSKVLEECVLDIGWCAPQGQVSVYIVTCHSGPVMEQWCAYRSSPGPSWKLEEHPMNVGAR